MTEIISNPFVNSQQINSETIIDEYHTLYVLCYSRNEPINDSIYHYMIQKDLFEEISKDLVLIKGNKKLLKNYTHLTKVNILSKHLLNKYNINNFQLDEKNLVLPIFNIDIDNFKLYLSQFENTITLVDIFKIFMLNKYFNVNQTNQCSLAILQKNIMDLNESNYWTNIFNCKANLSSCFEKRKINFYCLKNVADDYLKEIYRNKSYIDPSKIILNNDYKFKINQNNIFSK